jgi:hypothetical protein
MDSQILGTLTFARNPSWMTIIRPDRYSSHVLTYTSVGFFSWGVSVIGKVIELKWNAMSIDDYEDIQDLWEADAEVVFDPKDGESLTYDVEILDLKGEYCRGIADGDTGIRKNITLKLLILSSDAYPE